jgi:hypothetical protein
MAEYCAPDSAKKTPEPQKAEPLKTGGRLKVGVGKKATGRKR